jgi:ADP-heptose:LPS heptosyltransferase
MSEVGAASSGVADPRSNCTQFTAGISATRQAQYSTGSTQRQSSQMGDERHRGDLQRRSRQPLLGLRHLTSVLHDARRPEEVLAGAANDLLALGRPDLARAVAGLALVENAQCANAHSVLGVVHDALAEWQDGLAHARRAVELQPSSPQLKYNLALSTLRLDDYVGGFVLMEARIDKPDWSGFAIAPSRAAERHRLLRPGDPVEGRRILVIIEQGLGDCIMFARYLPLLGGRGARITLACSPPLRPLFERVAGIEALLSPPPEQPLAKINLSLAEFDAWVPLMSLPFYFATEFASVPAKVPYLSADPVRIAAWRERYEAAGRQGAPKVGLVFQANPQSGSSADRSLSIGDLAPLLGIAKIDPVNLQGGAAGRQLAAEHPGIIDATNPEIPLDEFAAAVAATDLVVTVDTMAAHCAGALGHPVWIVVPYSPHWCWGVGRDLTPWYPTARLLRQDVRQDWSNVVETMTQSLKQHFLRPQARRVCPSSS